MMTTATKNRVELTDDELELVIGGCGWNNPVNITGNFAEAGKKTNETSKNVLKKEISKITTPNIEVGTDAPNQNQLEKDLTKTVD